MNYFSFLLCLMMSSLMYAAADDSKQALPEQYKAAVQSICYLKENIIVAGYEGGVAKWWDLETGRCLFSKQVGDNIVFIRHEADSDRVSIYTKDTRAKVYTRATGEYLTMSAVNAYKYFPYVVLPDNRVAFVSGSDDIRRDVAVCKVADACQDIIKGLADGDFTELACLHGHTQEVSALALLADQSTLVSAAVDETIVIWNLASYTSTRKIRLSHASAYSLAALTGSLFAAGMWDGTIGVYDAANCSALLRSFRAHKGMVMALLALPSRQLVSGGLDGYIRVWGEQQVYGEQQAVREEDVKAAGEGTK